MTTVNRVLRLIALTARALCASAGTSLQTRTVPSHHLQVQRR